MSRSESVPQLESDAKTQSGVINDLGYAALSPTTPLEPFAFTRRAPGPHEVLVKIAYCGVCHSDLHASRNDWGSTSYPIVPGHEITGHVESVGEAVTKFKVGDRIGISTYIGTACKDTCDKCTANKHQLCRVGLIKTYNTPIPEPDLTITPEAMAATHLRTRGGYSSHYVVHEKFAYRLDPRLDMAATAPLLCAGITVYAPLKRHGAGPGKRVAILGLGGLGHVGAKIAHAMGADTTVISSSPNKVADARRFGVKVAAANDPETFNRLAKSFDIILNTISAEIDMKKYMPLLDSEGVMVLCGLPPSLTIPCMPMVTGERKIEGSYVGDISEVQEMLDFCAEHGIGADIEMIKAEEINTAFERLERGDVKYRFVIDIATMPKPESK